MPHLRPSTTRLLALWALCPGLGCLPSAQAQRVGPAASLPTVVAGSCELEIRPPAASAQSPTFMVVSYKPPSDQSALEATVITSSGDPAFDQGLTSRLGQCRFEHLQGLPAGDPVVPHGAKGLLLLPVRAGLGVRPFGPPAPAASGACQRAEYPLLAARDGRGGSVTVQVVGTPAGDLARIELSVSSGQTDLDMAALQSMVQCSRWGAKPGAERFGFRWSVG
jgi:TonB family protein